MKKLTTAEFISRSRLKHGDRYDYSEAEYTGSDARVRLRCSTHGLFEQRAYNHMNGVGCPGCATDAGATVLRDSLETFIGKARAVHGDRYQYIGPYRNAQTPITIVCPDHGPWQQRPGNHLQGNGCPRCHRAATAYTPEEFAAAAGARHGGKYTYTGFRGVDHKLDIACPVHGTFRQEGRCHLEGQQCPHCATKGSRAESGIAMFLSAYTRVVLHATVGDVSVDVWCPDIALAVEHNGELFHADISMQGKAVPVDRHLKKQQAVEATGARLIQFWGTEWAGRRMQCEAILRRAAGVPEPAIGARRLRVVELDSGTATRFYDRHHVQGAPRGGRHFGLVGHDGSTAACMTFSATADVRGAAALSGAHAHEVRLTRFASSGRVVGGASRLLAAGRRAFPGATIVSYSDPRLFTGKMYAALGFRRDATLPPDYSYYVPNGRALFHKSQFQRSRLESWRQRLGFTDAEIPPFDPATDVRTERTMTDLMGVRRCYGVGLVRWVLP